MTDPADHAQAAVRRRFKVGEAEVRPDINLVLRDGENRYLRQQAMQVLVYLANRPGELVSKDELHRSIWDNAAVTDDALVQCVVEIRKALGDDPRRPRFVRTVPKGGYSFIGPVSSIEPTEDGPLPTSKWLAAPPAIAPPARRVSVWQWATAAIVVAGLTAAALFTIWSSRAATVTWAPQPGKLRVLVLGFENPSNREDLAWMQRGLPEMIVTGLARSPGLSVLPPSEVMLLPGGEVADLTSAVKLARTTNAEAFIVGSFSAVGEALRVDARVHQADGTLIGSQSLTAAHREAVLSEIDRLAEGLSRTLGRPLTANEAALHLGDVMTSDLSAYREYTLGVAKASALESEAALTHFQNAVRADANFAMAHARIGYTYSITMGVPARGEAFLASAFRLKERLREQDRLAILAWYALTKLDYDGAIDALRTLVARFPDDIEHYWLLSRTLRGEERHDEALSVVTAGLRINPRAKNLYNELRGLHETAGRFDLGLAAAQKYVELSPKEPNAHDSLGLSYQAAGQYAHAIASYETALALDPTFDIAIIHLGNTLVAQGRYNEALKAYERHTAMMNSSLTKVRGQVSQAWVHYYRGDADRAMRLMAATQYYPSVPRYDIAMVALTVGDRARFDAELAKPITLSNRGARFPRRLEYYMRGLKAQAEGKHEEAITLMREASRQSPIIYGIPTLDDCLANAYFGYGRWVEAEAEYRRLLVGNPHAAVYVYRLGQIAERSGRRDVAAKEYRRFLDLWSTADADVPEVVAARAWLSKTHALQTAAR